MKVKPYALELKINDNTVYAVCFGADKSAAGEALKGALFRYNLPPETTEEARERSERDAVLEFLSIPCYGGSLGKTSYQIKKALTRKKGSPFRIYTNHGQAPAMIDKAIKSLLISGEITCSGHLSNKRYTKA